ncbi:MAG: phage portal protein [Rhizobiaceae bacterium]|nr:phage portal protein [Rhizobiaceae bacterium]
MSLLKSLFNRRKYPPEIRSQSASLPLSSADALSIFAPVPATSLPPVDAMTALRCTPFRAGIAAICDAVAQMDGKLYRRSDCDRTGVVDHPAAKILQRPNAWAGAAEFQSQLFQDLLLHGNGIALVLKAGGKPKEIHRIDPRTATIRVDLDTGEPWYEISMQAGGTRTYGYRDVIHLKGCSIDGASGLSAVHLGQDAIGLALVLEKHAAKLFNRGAKPGGILEAAKTLTAGAIQRLRAQFESIHGNADNAGKTLILEEGMTFKQTQLSSVDAQFLELRRFQVLEIARLLNVPPPVLADLENSGQRANTEELNRRFLTATVSPLLEKFEDALEIALLSEEERDEFEIEFDESDLLRADTEKRFGAYKTGVEAGILTINEARAREGLPPVAGGDTPMRSVQTLPLTGSRNTSQGSTDGKGRAA